MNALCKELSVQGAAPRRKDAIRSILNRQSALVGTAAALVMVAMTPSNALAACASSLGTIVCSVDAGKYASGINESDSADLTVIIEDGVEIEPTSGTDAVNLSSGSNVSLSSGATIVVNNGRAIDVDAYGNAVVTQTGAIVSTGQSDEYGAAVRVFAYNGYADVSVADITTSGYEEDALQVTSYYGSASVTVDGSLSTSGNQAWGVSVLADDSADLTVTGDVSTLGNNSTAIGVFSNGSASVTVDGTVSTEGWDADGVSVRADGDVTVSLADVSTQGSSSTAIYIETYSTWDYDTYSSVGSNVTLTAGNVSTAGYNSTAVDIYAQGTVAATLGDVSTQGSRSTAIDIETYATWDGEADAYVGSNVTLTAGNVSTADYNSTAVYIDAEGTVTATLGDVSTSGHDSNAIDIRTDGYFYGEGVTYTLTADISLTAGAISTQGDDSYGVSIYTEGGAVDVTLASVSTQGDDSTAIDIGTDSTETYADGDWVVAAGDVTLSVAGDITTQGDDADAVNIYAEGTVNVTLGNVSTQGWSSDAIDIYTDSDYGEANHLTLTVGNVSTQGGYADAIRLETDTDGGQTADIVLTAGNVSTAYFESDAVNIEADGSVTATLGNVSTLGRSSSAIEIEAYAQYDYDTYTWSGGDVTLTAGDVTTAGKGSDAVDIDAEGSVTVTLGNVSTLGEDSDGILISANTYNDYASDRQADVTLTAGNVSTVGDDAHGVRIDTYGTVNATLGNVSTQGNDSGAIQIWTAEFWDPESETYSASDVTLTAGDISTVGDDSTGVYLWSQGGSVTATLGDVSTSGANSHAVVIMSGGDVSLTSSGTISTAGTDSAALAVMAYGDVTLNLTNVSSAAIGGSTVQVRNEGDATVSVSGDISGPDHYYPTMQIETGGVATVNIGADGSIAGSYSALSVYAAETVTVSNAGTINGGVELFGSQVAFNNSGTFDVTNRSYFGGEDDKLVNSGKLVIREPSAQEEGSAKQAQVAWTGNAPFRGLETLENSGVISVTPGVAGDEFVFDGDFVSNGGSFALDLDLGTGIADIITLNGDVSGHSTFVVNLMGQGIVELGSEVDLLQSSAPVSLADYGLAALNHGFVSYSLTANDNIVSLFADVGDPVFRGLKINEAAQSIWNESATVVFAQAGANRNAKARTGEGLNGRIWGQFFGSVDQRDETTSYKGLMQTRDVGLSYRQAYHGVQMGIDLQGADSQTLVYGLTGGLMTSKLNFRTVSDSADFTAANIGGYVGVTKGKFFANGLAKYDYYDAKSRSDQAGYEKSFDGYGLGVQAEVGARLGGAKFFFEPVASLNYVRTSLDSLKVQDQILDFKAMDGLRGKVGARLGGVGAIGESKLTYYAGGHAVKEFAGKDGVRFTSGDQTLSYDNQRVGTYGEVELGLNIISAGGVTGFFEANTQLGDDYEGYGARAGIRFGF